MKRMLPEVLNIVRRYRTNNPNELAELLGIDVYYVNMSLFYKQYGMKAAYMKAGFFKGIIINRTLSANERNVALAHELGHIFPHHGGYHWMDFHLLSREEKKIKELNANKFAFLLISHTCLRNRPSMIDGIRDEKVLTIEDTTRLLAELSIFDCFAAGQQDTLEDHEWMCKI